MEYYNKSLNVAGHLERLNDIRVFTKSSNIVLSVHSLKNKI